MEERGNARVPGIDFNALNFDHKEIEALMNSVNKINSHNIFPLYHKSLPLYRRRPDNRRKTILPGESGKISSKELDPETGFYYYGARYLDPRTSRWLSGDPALGEYIPAAPINDEVKKSNGNLPGQGGVFNLVNLHVYHYAGNNPVKYVDPDGRDDEELKTYIPREFALKEVLKEIVNSDNIDMKAYQRKPFSTNVPKTGLSYHSFYSLTIEYEDETSETYTLSFNGTENKISSEGAWVLNTSKDVESMQNRDAWKVVDITPTTGIDTKSTINKILGKINSDTTYFVGDGIINKSNQDNCNTTLDETIVPKTK